MLRLRRARGCAVTVDGATWVRALGVLSPHPTGDLPLLDGRRQQAGAPLSRRRRRLPRAAASAVRAAPLTDPVDAHGPLADVRARVRHALRAATGAAGAARKGHFRVRHFGGVVFLTVVRASSFATRPPTNTVAAGSACDRWLFASDELLLIEEHGHKVSRCAIHRRSNFCAASTCLPGVCHTSMVRLAAEVMRRAVFSALVAQGWCCTAAL